MNKYILLSMLSVFCVYASEQPLDTSAVLELSSAQGTASVLYTKDNGILQLRLHDRGVSCLKEQNAPLKVSVLLNRDENNISLLRYDELRQKPMLYDQYYFMSLPSDVNLAIMEEAVNFSIDEKIHSAIRGVSKGAALYLSYKLSLSEAQALRATEKRLEEIDAYERSPIVRLRRLISQGL